MKSLTPTKPLGIMVVGLPGSGKSFFARQFSETFSAPLASWDQLRRELYPQPTYSAEQETRITRIANYMITELIRTRKTFLIDGGCNARSVRQTFAAQLRQAGYDTLIVWSQVDEATARRRATKRQAADDHEVISPEIFDKLAPKFTAPNRLEPVVVVSGKHTYPTQARIVLRKLVAPREQQPLTPPSTPRPRPEGQSRRDVPIQ